MQLLVIAWCSLTVTQLSLQSRIFCELRLPDELLEIDDKPHWEIGYQDFDESVPDCTN